jgi:ribosomal protein L37AE/L43A
MHDDEPIEHRIAQRELKRAMDELRILTRKSSPDEPESKFPYCSFCGKGVNEVRRMIAGRNVWICNECILLIHKIMEESELGS